MGFSNIWSILLHDDDHKEILKVSDSNSSYLIIDYYNFLFFLQVEKSSIYFNEAFIRKFWELLIASNFHIIVVKDGKYHSPNRTVIKLIRNVYALFEDGDSDEG